jgi:hypothetical protein
MANKEKNNLLPNSRRRLYTSATLKNLFLLFVLFLAASSSLVYAQAQDPSEDAVRVRTRVVSIDTLVLDKKTGVPVADLTRENFEVLADGKPRALSYFRHGSDDRRPLALMLVIDLVGGGVQNYLGRPDILESLSAALKKLSPEDEVAVMAGVGGTISPLKTLIDFTRDRVKVAQALAAVPSLPMPEPRWYNEELAHILQNVERAAAERPDSQIIVVPVTSTFGPISFGKRDEIAAKLIRVNAHFSPLIRDPGTGQVRISSLPGQYPTPSRSIFAVIGRLTGTDPYAPKHIAEQTGGDVRSVQKPEDYGAALEQVIVSLSTRYNLGFALNQNEQDDGRLHKLEVRAKVSGGPDKKRKLIVRVRRGYFIPKVEELPAK